MSESPPESDIAEHEWAGKEATLYSQVLEGSLNEIYIFDDQTLHFVNVNQGARKNLGYSMEELRSLTPLSIKPELTLGAFTDLLEPLRTGDQQTVEFTTVHQRKDGSKYPVEVYLQLLGGDTPLFVAIILDITERKLAQNRLREALAAAHRAEHLVKLGTYAWDEEQDRLLSCSEGYARIHEMSVDEALQTFTSTGADFDYIHPDDRERIAAIEAAALTNAKGYTTQYRMQLPSGRTCHVREVFDVTVDDDGEIMRSVGSLQDVTEQVQLEEQLRQVQKMEALGVLAGGIAHDFNNLLTPILGHAEMLMDSVDQGGDRESVKSIHANALRARDLVSQVLLFSRRGRTAKKAEDLCSLIPELISFIHSTLPSTITVSEEVSVESAVVVSDASQIYQVLVNLCVNAGNAIIGNGEIRVTLDVVELKNFLGLTGKLLSGKYVKVAVSDDGEGMDEETLAHIFEPFYTTRGVGEGTGLGLSIVFGIVQDHGGEIMISSEPRSGTTFEIFLPLAETPFRQLPDTATQIQSRGSEHILFVDDEDAIAFLGKRSLEGLGYQVTVASDGQSALAAFSENPERFDLLVTDQTMPKLTGDLLIKEVLKVKRNMPVILCTGHDTTITPENSKAIGIDGFIHKPYRPKALGQLVRELLDKADEAEP